MAAGPGRLLIQAALRDQKPPGLFIPDDPEPLTIHPMTLAMELELPAATIVSTMVERMKELETEQP